MNITKKSIAKLKVQVYHRKMSILKIATIVGNTGGASRTYQAVGLFGIEAVERLVVGNKDQLNANCWK